VREITSDGRFFAKVGIEYMRVVSFTGTPEIMVVEELKMFGLGMEYIGDDSHCLDIDAAFKLCMSFFEHHPV
jgi:hypothetical protein